MALNAAKEKVLKLENAIKKLDGIKKHLSHSAADIKGEIHSCVSHNLECLRGREVSLLNKVDELVSLKEEALQQQQARLNQALGVLKTRMALTADSALDKQMTEILAKFNEIDLSPDETPHIAFRADHMSLRECILNYGRVDSNALPLPTAFDDPGKPSASLPRHLEDYEDVDHHIFYKTVQELKQNNPSSTSITVSIPKLSTKMEDWLQTRLGQNEKDKTLTAIRPNDLHSRSSLNLPSQTSTNPKGTSCSLNSWLSQIKGHADQEEEHNFEIVDNTCQNKVNSGCSSSKYEDLKPWLINASEYLDSMRAVQAPSQNHFRHIPSDTKFWLQQSQQRSDENELKQKDMFAHISKEPSTWLRSRAYGKLQEGKAGVVNDSPVSFQDQDVNLWLAHPSMEVVENVNNNNSQQQVSWLQNSSQPKVQEKKKLCRPMFQLEDICKANELCSTLMDCVCKPDCALLRQQEMCGIKNPLDPAKVFNPTQLPTSEWLYFPDKVDDEKMDTLSQNGEENCKNKKVSSFGSVFDRFVQDESDLWLIKPPQPTSEKISSQNISTNASFKNVKEEANLWLQQKEGDAEKTTKMTFNSTHMNKPMTDWLVGPDKFEDKVEEMKEDSEGWSICSTPTSFNSEQFSKDVYAATNYIESWVL